MQSLPTLLAFIVAFVIPFFMGLYLSFCNFKTIGSAKWVGLSNYLYVFRDSAGFLSALWFTVKVAIVGVVSTHFAEPIVLKLQMDRYSPIKKGITNAMINANNVGSTKIGKYFL